MSEKLSGQIQPYSKPANFRRRIAKPNLTCLNVVESVQISLHTSPAASYFKGTQDKGQCTSVKLSRQIRQYSKPLNFESRVTNLIEHNLTYLACSQSGRIRTDFCTLVTRNKCGVLLCTYKSITCRSKLAYFSNILEKYSVIRVKSLRKSLRKQIDNYEIAKLR